LIDTGLGCFPTALVNLLSTLGDLEMAEKVSRDCVDHPFITEDGLSNAYLCTRLVSDLTKNQYEGVFSCGTEISDLEQSLQKIYADRADEAMQIISEEKASGRVCGLEAFSYRGPSLVLVTQQEGNNHWIVDTDRGDFIDSGYSRNYSLQDLPVYGVMIVKNKKNPLDINYFCDSEGQPVP